MEQATPQAPEQLDKIDLADRRSDKYFIVLYWMRQLNICSVYLEDTAKNMAAEFTVDNDKALHYFYHPFTHPEAILNIYEPMTLEGLEEYEQS